MVFISAIVIGAVLGAAGWFLARGKQDIAIWLPIAAGIALPLLGAIIVSVAKLSENSGLGWKDMLFHAVLAAIGVVAVIGYSMYGGGKPAKTSE